MNPMPDAALTNTTTLGDAHDEPDTGTPPCDFCRRTVPCECAGEPCMCSCGRCMAEPLPVWRHR